LHNLNKDLNKNEIIYLPKVPETNEIVKHKVKISKKTMDSLKTKLYEKFTDLSNIVQGPLSVSKFLEEGVLTPEEVCI